ncbi:putative TPR domain-containing protein [Neospora caninum Liverpool]|uniref:Putative TPR domain-containing protein n=1 Tax=Neospora caninum (strain Liverpool) TaxID=572307 RepID=F0VFK6_NEOCL|nr:putative TPR domain-containing protein [Neospora caninum Liverpool]CBZ52500.1 putative TPR domain-containing protein [Neospora caninum Liverpool]|eukprot:XP_003882532.1 putative TPR domain-containing protein [Neospora caninum Liverpool]
MGLDVEVDGHQTDSSVHDKGNKAQDSQPPTALLTVDGDRPAVRPGEPEGGEIDARTRSHSGGEPRETPPEVFAPLSRISQMAKAMQRARCATGCTHRAVEVYRRLHASPASRGEPVHSASAACFHGGSDKGLLKTTRSSAGGMTQVGWPRSEAERRVSCLVEKVSWAWTCVVLQAPRQEAIHALFSDLSFLFRQHPRQPLSLPPHLVGGFASVPILSAEECVLIRLAAFRRQLRESEAGTPLGLFHSELGAREMRPRSAASGRVAEAGQPTTFASAAVSGEAANANSVDASQFEVTEVGFCWYLLAMIYERDARTTAETAEERSVLRRCAAVCYFRCILAWPFTLQSWVRLLPLLLSEPAALYCLSLLVYLRGERRCTIEGESFHEGKTLTAPSFPLSSLHDVLHFLFSPVTISESAFFAFFPRLPLEGNSARAQGVRGEDREIFVSILQRVATVQMCMARGEAKDALALLEDWTLLPEGSSCLEEIIGCCYLQSGQPERGACFLLRSVQQYQLLEQEEECLRRREGEDPDAESRNEIAEASLWINLEPPEEAGCRCSSALWQIGRRRAATALVDWLLQRPRAQATSQLWGAVGNLLSLHRKSDEALKALFRAVELADDYPYAYTLCAHELLQRNQREEAEALIEHGLRSRGLLKSLPLHALSLLLELHRQAKAETERGKRFSRNLNPNEEDQERLATFPGCLADPAALRELERLQHPQTLKKIAEQLLRIGQARRAYTLLLRAVRLLPADGEIFYRLGCIKAAFQQYGNALQFLQRAAKLAPLDPREAFSHLQAALRLTTDAKEQKRISEQVMDLWSCSDVTDELLTGAHGYGRARKYRPEGGTDPADEIYVDNLQPAETDITPDEVEPSRAALSNVNSAGVDAQHASHQQMHFHRLTGLHSVNVAPALSLLGSVTGNNGANSAREWASMWQTSGFS